MCYGEAGAVRKGGRMVSDRVMTVVVVFEEYVQRLNCVYASQSIKN